MATFPVVRNTMRRWLNSPLARIVIGVIVCSLAMLGCNGVLRSVLLSEGGAARPVRWLVSAAVTLATYYLLYRRYERREIIELSLAGSLGESLFGLTTGTFSISLTIIVLYAQGYYQPISVNNASGLLLLLLFFATLSVFEEVIFRGIVYRIAEQNLGTAAALGISATLFGLAHLSNPHANAVSLVSAASGGILAGLLFSLTRRLWLPIFFHAGWNWAQSSLGVVVSGIEDLPAVVEARLEGPDLFTGGAFGPENSIITVVLVLALAGLAYYLAWKRGNIIRRAGHGVGIADR